MYITSMWRRTRFHTFWNYNDIRYCNPFKDKTVVNPYTDKTASLNIVQIVLLKNLPIGNEFSFSKRKYLN